MTTAPVQAAQDDNSDHVEMIHGVSIQIKGFNNTPSLATAAKKYCKKRGFNRADDWDTTGPEGVSDIGPVIYFDWIGCQ
jgi:hypothetical protein